MKLLALVYLLLSTIVCRAAANPAFEQRCLSFAPEQIVANATRRFVEYVPNGTTVAFPDNDGTCNRAKQAVSANLCRIALSIKISQESSIVFEAWFPEHWTGRFLATGNGGIDGCIKYEDLAYTSSYGFAAVGANNGKDGTGGLPFYHKPEVVVDFAWRSLHKSVEIGKSFVEAFYEQPHVKSYYLGCSLGGRQGIGSAERFPGDFDGIVAGAPGVDFNNLISWRAHFFPITGTLGLSDFISADAWKTWIHDEVLRQCDLIDGVEDGIIEDPTLCTFDPSKLLCTGSATGSCLSEAQVRQVTQIYSNYKYPDGQIIYSAMQPGSETGAASGLYAGAAWAYSENWFKYVVYGDPSWNASTYGFDDARAAEALNPGNIRTFPSSLPEFEKKGAKLLIYHGRQDAQITSFNTDRFYKHLRGQRSSADMDQWVRYFQISGTNHCSTGPGAWVMGQGGNAAAAGIPFEASRNVLKAVVDWVEEGIAPEYLEGTKFVNDTVSMGVDFTRRHCRYPLRNTYMGGNHKDALSWHCLDRT